MKENRYKVTMVFNVYATSDEMAKKEAQYVADYVKSSSVCEAFVEKLELAPYGDLKTYNVEL